MQSPAGFATSIILHTLLPFTTTTIAGLLASRSYMITRTRYVESSKHSDLVSFQHSVGLIFIAFFSSIQHVIDKKKLLLVVLSRHFIVVVPAVAVVV